MSALAGVRVIELAHERCAFAGKMLADMGADVVVIEPIGGAPMRGHEPFVGDRRDPEHSLNWWHYNTSKRGVALDWTRPEGRTALLALIQGADILLEAEDPGVLAAHGFTDEDLTSALPNLIHVSLTPFGPDGARRDERTTDLTLLAGGGMVWSCGYDDHSLPPIRGGGNQGYQTGCHYAVMSALTAYLHREMGGRGQRIDVSLHAAANVTTESSSYSWLVAKATVQRQTGRHAATYLDADPAVLCGRAIRQLRRAASHAQGLRRPPALAARSGPGAGVSRSRLPGDGLPSCPTRSTSPRSGLTTRRRPFSRPGERP